MNTVKILMSAAVIAALVVPASAQHPGSALAAAGKCTGTRVGLNVSGWSGADQEGDMVQHELSMFEAQNPCITTYFSPIPSDYQKKIQTEFAANAEPDVMYISPDMTYNEGKGGKLLDLTPYLAKDGVSLGQYIQSLLKEFQIGNKVYGLPKDWGTLGIFYNKSIFDAKHIAYPSNNLTWDQFRTLAKQLTTQASNSANTIYGTMMPEDWARFAAVAYAFGTGLIDPLTGKVEFNNANAVKALDFYTSFQLADHSATVPSTVGDGWQGDSFGKGKVAMVIEGGWLTPYLRSTYPKIKFGVAQIPVGPAGRADPLFTNAWGVSADTVKAGSDKAAVKLAEFLSGPVVQKYQTDIGFSLPTISSLASDPYIKSHPEAANLFNSGPYGKIGDFGTYDTVGQKALTDAITAVLLGKATPQKAIANAANYIQSQETSVP